MLDSIYEYIVSDHICTFLDFKNRYYLSITSNFFKNAVNFYKKRFKQKNIEMYLFIVSKLRENAKRGLPILRNIFFCPMNLNERICIYSKDIENGIYFYWKNSDTFVYSHKLYIVIYVKEKKHKTRIFDKYYDPYLEESEIEDNFYLQFNEKIIKIA